MILHRKSNMIYNKELNKFTIESFNRSDKDFEVCSDLSLFDSLHATNNLFAKALQIKLCDLLNTDHTKIFVNGGWYESGHSVYETIIKTPSRQFIFTFCVEQYNDVSHLDTWENKFILINKKEVKFERITCNENGLKSFLSFNHGIQVYTSKTKYEESLLKVLDYKSNDSTTHCYSIYFSINNFNYYIESLAILIKHFYFDDLSYEEFISKTFDEMG